MNTDIEKKIYKSSEIKIAILGGSSLTINGNPDIFPKALHKKMGIIYPNLICKIQSHIEKNTTTFDGVDIFEQHLTKFMPDIVLIGYGYDDCFQIVYRSEYRENLINMIRFNEHTLKSRLLFISSHPMERPSDWHFLRMYVNGMRDIARDYHIPVIRLDNLIMNKVYLENEEWDKYLIDNSRHINENGLSLLLNNTVNHITLDLADYVI